MKRILIAAVAGGLIVFVWSADGFPAAFIAAGLVTEFVGWLLAGFAIAKIVPAPFVSARASVAA